MYQLRLTSRAQRELDKLSTKNLVRVVGVLQKLGDNPRPVGTRKLRGPIHRIRVGDWRVIYAVFDKENLVIIGKIARRSKDIYSGFNELF
ncbi:MAG TPA: type II toxin-antitoxin system RelE/ParE family toxin [Dehalococcoidales bacterium]